MHEMNRNEHHALVLSGGGAKGAFSVGVVDWIFKNVDRLSIKLAYGTSTGALIASKVAASVAQNDRRHIDDLVEIYSRVQKDDVLEPRCKWAYNLFGETGALVCSWFNKYDSIYSTKPLIDLVDKYMNDDDWQSIIESGFDLGFCVTSLQEGSSFVVSSRQCKNIDEIKTALQASVNQPLLMELKTINNQQCVDGGLTDFVPLRHVFKSPVVDEVDSIVAISNNAEYKAKSSSQEFKKIDAVLARSVEVMADHVLAEDFATAKLINLLLSVRDTAGWDDVEATLPSPAVSDLTTYLRGKKNIPIQHIMPPKHTQVTSLGFEQPAMKELVKYGYEYAQDHISVV